MTSRHPPSFGRWLTATGLLSEAELARAEAQRQSTGERLPDTLVRLGLSSADEVAQALARHLEIGYVDRTEFPSSPPFLQRLSPQYMRQYRFCPLAVDGGALVVACADPTDPTVVDELRGTLGLEIRLSVATEAAILEAIERYFGAGSTAVQKVIEGMGEDERGDETGGEDLTSLRDMAFDAPVVRLVNLLIENAIKAGASDIHIEPFEDALRVRYRIDGVLYDVETPPKRLQAAVIVAHQDHGEAEHRRAPPAAGRAHPHRAGGTAIDLRVSTMPTLYGESVVMRILDRSAILLPLETARLRAADTLGVRWSASSSCPTACCS